MTQQILLSLIAGAAGGIVPLLTGLMLQRRRSDLELRNEIAKRKIKAVDESWSAMERCMTGWEISASDEKRKTKKPRLTRRDFNNLWKARPIADGRTLEEETDHTSMIISSNRIWLSQDMYDALMDFMKSSVTQVVGKSGQDEVDVAEMERKIDEARSAALAILRKELT